MKIPLLRINFILDIFAGLQGMKKQFIIYGILLAVITLALKLAQYKLVIINHSLEMYGLVIAALFTAAGVWAGIKITGKKEVEVVVERTVYLTGRSSDNFHPDETVINKLGISKREFEILGLIAKGASNQEIANELYLSVNTVKTHTSNLFMKLDVRRRTQAVQKGKELNLIP